MRKEELLKVQETVAADLSKAQAQVQQMIGALGMIQYLLKEMDKPKE